MKITPLKTRRFKPPQDSLDDLLDYLNGQLSEECIVVISSKVLAICEGRTIQQSAINEQELIKQEADQIWSRRSNHDVLLTRKSDMLLEYAGIDRSRDGYYILLPEQPFISAHYIWKVLRERSGIKKIGVIITDSHSVPFRRGAIGFAVGGYGFEPVAMFTSKDTSKVKKTGSALAVLDSLAASANFVIGEGKNITPLAIIENADVSYFTEEKKPQYVQEMMRVHEDEVYSW